MRAETASSRSETTLKVQAKDAVKRIIDFLRVFEIMPEKKIRELEELIKDIEAACSIMVSLTSIDSQPEYVRSSPKQDFKLPDFKVLSEKLPHYQKARRDFMETFPKWHYIRWENIQSLRTIGGAMHRKRSECNDFRLVGSTLSAIGGAMTFVGAVSSPFTLGLSAPLAALGTVLIGTGTLGTTAASVSEKNKLKESLQDATSKLQREERLYERMVHFFECHDEIKKAFLDIIDLPNKESLCFLVGDIRFASDSTVDMIKKIYALVGKRLSESTLKNCIPLIATLSFIVRYFRVVTDFLKKTLNFSVEVRAITSGVVGGGVGIATLLDKRTATKTAMKKALCRGILASVSVLMDIITMVETSKDIDNGSKSKEGLRLERTAEYLEKEQAILKEIYQLQVGG